MLRLACPVIFCQSSLPLIIDPPVREGLAFQPELTFLQSRSASLRVAASSHGHDRLTDSFGIAPANHGHPLDRGMLVENSKTL